MQQRFLAPVLLVITALLWSLGGVLIKSIDWPPMAIAAGRSIAAIPVLLAFAGRQRFTFSPAQIGGAIAYAATVALFVFATRMTTAANAIFLQYTAPIDGHQPAQLYTVAPVVPPPPAAPTGNVPPQEGPNEGVHNV